MSREKLRCTTDSQHARPKKRDIPKASKTSGESNGAKSPWGTSFPCNSTLSILRANDERAPSELCSICNPSLRQRAGPLEMLSPATTRSPSQTPGASAK